VRSSSCRADLADIALGSLHHYVGSMPEVVTKHSQEGGCGVPLCKARVGVVEDKVPPIIVLPSGQLKQCRPTLHSFESLSSADDNAPCTVQYISPLADTTFGSF
jgi:hypothetical protein